VWGVKSGRCVGLTTSPPSVSRSSKQYGILNISQLYRPYLLLKIFQAYFTTSVSLSHDCLHPDPFQFIIHQYPSHSSLVQCRKVGHKHTHAQCLIPNGRQHHNLNSCWELNRVVGNPDGGRGKWKPAELPCGRPQSVLIHWLLAYIYIYIYIYKAAERHVRSNRSESTIPSQVSDFAMRYGEVD
jgi:hypothetical protein